MPTLEPNPYISKCMMKMGRCQAARLRFLAGPAIPAMRAPRHAPASSIASFSRAPSSACVSAACARRRFSCARSDSAAVRAVSESCSLPSRSVTRSSKAKALPLGLAAGACRS